MSLEPRSVADGPEMDMLIVLTCILDRLYFVFVALL